MNKETIQSALIHFKDKSLLEGSLAVLNSLGYKSDASYNVEDSSFKGIQLKLKEDLHKEINPEKCISKDWVSFQFLFQFSPEDTNHLFKHEESRFKKIDSFIFATLDLEGDKYSRSELAAITREMNKPFQMPVILLFRYGSKSERLATLSVIDRRISKSLDTNKSQEHVLEKVSLIHNINLANPHRAHIEILNDLDLQALKNAYVIDNFIDLYDAWQKVLDTKELNKKFYRDLSNWYFWALKKVSFPFAYPNNTKEDLLSITLIRFITRLIFVWFLKEKKLIPTSLFEEKYLSELLEGFSPKGKKTIFYTSILQNLFFGTLNTYRNGESGTDSNESLSRKFRNPVRDKQGRTDDYMVTNLYRYETNFKDKNKILDLFKDIPFLNGGLFECLDKRESKEETEKRLDCFSDVEKKQPNFPDYLFFSEKNEMDLSDEYGDKKHKSESVNGIILILNKYKFTVEENTPLEEEIALDPELLGKVFENLLASYNPETSTTARKQTGSFYTPREIVNYMVEESLVAYYKNTLLEEGIGHTVLTSNENVMFPEAASGKKGQLELTTKLDNNPWKEKEEELEKNLRVLLADGNTSNPFLQDTTEKLVRATGNAKILDPACGSGAFPMGVLHKMVHVLRKLDPENKSWKQEQLNRNELEKKEIEKQIDADIKAVSKIHFEDVKKKAIAELEEKKKSIEINFSEHEADYARKLYLIENCIYGVDIQPIAVQITKLRFFISLIVDQKMNPAHKNLGIIPLPNLETKFVAANTLVGLEKPHEEELLSKKDSILLKLENELNTIRKKYFYSRSRSEKIKLKQEDKHYREEIFRHFLGKNDKFKKDLEEKLKVGKLPKESIKEIFEFIDNRESESTSALQQFVTQLCKQNKMDTGISKKAIAECNRYFPPKSASDIASWDPYNQNSHADWFDPEHMFGLLVGFDIVIGNPPYVSALDFSKVYTEDLRDVYNKHYTVAKGTYDIYTLFFEFGLNSIRNNGVVSLITPNKFLSASYGIALRDFIHTKSKITTIVDLSSIKVFKEASVYPIITILQNTNINTYLIRILANSYIREEFNDKEMNEIFIDSKLLTLLPEKIWGFLISSNSHLITKINESNSYTLESLGNVNATSTASESDEYGQFIFSKYVKESLKILNTGTIDRYTDLWATHELTHSRQKFIKPFFHYKKAKVSERRFEMYTSPKIIFAKMAIRCEAFFDIRGEFASINTNCFYKPFKVTTSLAFIASVVNSLLFTFFYELFFGSLTMSGGYYQFQSPQLRVMPIPRSPIDNPKLQQPLITLVDKILTAKGKDSFADTSKWEAEIDARVFHLYGLTEEEMLTVLNSFPKMSDMEKLKIQNFYRDIENGILKGLGKYD